ncbi:acyl transferase carnitine dehydratase [Apiospora arundinis]|uniref:Acyl transferase carnitine dehydratase n=1 Tax=Apiospora arundinis TaxID=335852 RepID=A0ABR2J4F9_9PEZI
MSRIVSGQDFYGPGSWIDFEALPVPQDTRRLLRILSDATPGFTKDQEVLDSVTFTGSPETVTPGPLKSSAIAGALHAMSGIIANELLVLRDGPSASRTVSRQRGKGGRAFITFGSRILDPKAASTLYLNNKFWKYILSHFPDFTQKPTFQPG